MTPAQEEKLDEVRDAVLYLRTEHDHTVKRLDSHGQDIEGLKNRLTVVHTTCGHHSERVAKLEEGAKHWGRYGVTVVVGLITLFSGSFITYLIQTHK